MFVFECPAGHMTEATKATSVECPQCFKLFKRLKKVEGPTPEELRRAGKDKIQRRRSDDIH